MKIRYDLSSGVNKIKTKATIIVATSALSIGGVGASLALFGTAHAAVGGPTCGVPTDYATIQAAVNDPGCSTINVAPGTYPESVTINRSLILDGAKAGKDARSRSGAESIIIEADVNTPNITITADNVTVDGFTVNGPSNQGTAAFVMQTGNSGEMIENNIVNNPGRAASITTSNTTFRRNRVNNTTTAGDGFQANSTPVHNDTITDNNFSGATSSNYRADITFIEGNANIIVSGNKSVTDGTLVALFKTNGAKVTDNTITGVSDSSAIYIGGADSNILVRDNKVTSASSGVNVANDFGDGVNSNVTITDNNLHGNVDGIKVKSGAVATDNTVVAHQNSITGNTDEGFNNLSNFNANATCNWWDSAGGPGPVGVGSGDKVTTEVAFSPWLQSSHDGDCKQKVSGELRMSNPSQRIKFNVTAKADITQPQGTVEYWNFDYPGGLNYSATVTCSYVDPQTGEARFMFQIPTGHDGLSGLYVVAYVKSVKHGADLYGHASTSDQATATQWCENGVGFSPTMYPVTHGEVDIED